MANLWNNSWLIVAACYSGLIMIGGIIVMSHESVQSRYSMKEIAPRLVVSFFASMLSLFVIDKVIRLANALSAAVLAAVSTHPSSATPWPSRSTVRTPPRCRAGCS